MHFFNPVPIMELLELVRHDTCSEETIALAQAAGAKFFFPAAAFFGAEGAFFARFVNVGAWATVFFQFLASLVFAVIAEY